MDPVNLSQSSQEVVLENVQPSAGIGENYKEYKPLFERFGAKEGIPTTERAFAQIWEYAKDKSELKDKDSVMWEVTKLMNKMGSPSIGDKPWSKALVYIQTHRQLLETERRLKELEGIHG